MKIGDSLVHSKLKTKKFPVAADIIDAAGLQLGSGLDARARAVRDKAAEASGSASAKIDDLVARSVLICSL